MAGPNRADPFAGDLDLTDFKPVSPNKPKPETAKIREVSEANNFPSRAAPKAASPPPAKGVQRRRRTGRNVQFNLKVTPETVTRFTALSDSQGWVFGETLDRALDALEQSLRTKPV